MGENRDLKLERLKMAKSFGAQYAFAKPVELGELLNVIIELF